MAPLIPVPAVSAHDILDRLRQDVPGTRLNPSRTLSYIASKVVPRQATTTVVSDDDNSNAAVLSGGAIAGIVIGSIVGFLLLLWLIRSCLNLNNNRYWGNNFEPEHEKPVKRHRHSHPYHHEKHRSHSRHSHHSRHGRSPARSRSVEVRPVYYARSKSPRVPTVVYTTDTRDLRRSSVGSSRRY